MGSLLAMLAGLVSFPLFTRIFSVEEYGLLSLIASALLILVAVAKLGVQHSIVRFYAEAAVAKAGSGLAQFYSTVFFGLAASGLAASVLWAVSSQLIAAERWSDPRIRGLLLLTAGLVFIRAVDSGLANILRAQQRSLAFNVYLVVKRYSILGAVLVTIFHLLPGLKGFYVATIAVEALAVVALMLFMRRTCRFSIAQFSLPRYRAMLAFGIPMIAYEVGGTIFAIGDRFVIQHLLGEGAVGIYSAAYGVCEYVQLILLGAVGQAIVPMYMRIWEEKGEAEVRDFVQKSLYYYVMIGAAVVAGLAAVDAELLTLLASEKYRVGASVIPYIIASMVVGGAGAMLNVGLHIHKQTRTLAVLVALCAVLNIVLNVILIPWYGIEGSAAATLLSGLVLCALALSASNRSLRIALPWRAFAKFPLLSILMFLAVREVTFADKVVTLFAKCVVGALVYMALVLIFDRATRVEIAGVLRKWRAGSSR